MIDPANPFRDVANRLAHSHILIDATGHHLPMKRGTATAIMTDQRRGSTMGKVLPPDISQGAELRGNEYGWSVSSFPGALTSAEAHGYACLGGQFQFRLDDGSTCEMYWLNADSKERTHEEPWGEYCHRSCSEVLIKFRHLVSDTDFATEALTWPSIAIDPTKGLVFVAYFVTESELAELTKNV